ncbi:ubiquitin-associated domain-containing protein 2 isoform X2 [Meriones unguiculatus]|uniref:ubiquitin-associated domain-containing protein 2 isoform X2 n=1 Tax=Meriones unguiculatus TaxID=10047 RepID=UPI00293F2D19|nr:ubiquitin-associated domain-containing protein 2 isoform X2 [Meriones unguiculatus]
MFTSTGSSGLYKAPLSKSLLLVPGALSLLLALLLPHCQRFFLYDLRAVKNDLQVWRLICGRIICLDLKDTFCSSLLIYNFRIFERRYGSRKFASFLLGSWVLSALFDFILVEVVQHWFDVTVASELPSGFLAPVFALFVPFYCSIPRVQVAQILGPLSITNKTLIYVLGLQLFTSGSYIWIVAISGIIAGLCYDRQVLGVQQVLRVPARMALFFAWALEPAFSSPEPSSEAGVGMGATVDLQRQQRLEQLDRQLMLSQFAQVRRQRQQGGMINWNRLFPPLRQRRNINYQDGPRSEQRAAPPPEVSEEQVPVSVCVRKEEPDRPARAHQVQPWPQTPALKMKQQELVGRTMTGSPGTAALRDRSGGLTARYQASPPTTLRLVTGCDRHSLPR